MISGATYTLPLDIRYPLKNTEKMIITLKNETTGIKRLKHYPNNDETWLMSDGRIGIRLSQQDTLDLVGYVKIEAQINLSSGAVAKTVTARTYISETLNTEMVPGAMDDGETYLEGVSMEVGDPVTPIKVFANDEGAVHYAAEERTEEEKVQARANIGAASAERVEEIAAIQADCAQNDPEAADYVKNRTHYEAEEVVNEPLNLTWDGNTEGLTTIDGGGLYKVSDLILTNDHIMTAKVVISDGATISVRDVWEDMLNYGYATEDYVVIGDFFVVITRADNVTFDGIGITLPEAGIYFLNEEGFYVSSLTTVESIEHTKTIIHKLDKKYLPHHEYATYAISKTTNIEIESGEIFVLDDNEYHPYDVSTDVSLYEGRQCSIIVSANGSYSTTFGTITGRGGMAKGKLSLPREGDGSWFYIDFDDIVFATKDFMDQGTDIRMEFKVTGMMIYKDKVCVKYYHDGSGGVYFNLPLTIKIYFWENKTALKYIEMWDASGENLYGLRIDSNGSITTQLLGSV